MPSFNSVIVMGHLTRDPELRETASGLAVTEIGLAVNRRKKDGEEETSFFDVACFGKTAENVAAYQSKGSCIQVSGYLQQDRWQDKDTGSNRSKVKIVANHVLFIPKSQGKDANHSDNAPASQVNPDTGASQPAEADIPF